MMGLGFFFIFPSSCQYPCVFSFASCLFLLNFLYAVCPCNKDSMHLSPLHQNSFWGTFLVAQWIRLCVLNAGGLGLSPGQGTRSHRPQLRVCMLQKTRCSQINKLIKKKFIFPVSSDSSKLYLIQGSLTSRI